MMNHQQLLEQITQTWDEQIIPELIEFIKIPNKSPAFDSQWQEHGFMDQAVEQMVAWCQQQPIKDMTLDVVRLENRTPLIYIEIPGQIDDTILLYGHLDKQPEMTGWHEDLGPWKPVIKDNKLYGRGGADDGYAIYASLTAIAALQAQAIPHARCVVIIEACEESGSADLPHYLTALKDKIGQPNFVVCLDSGCANYDQLWSTTSLRGMIGATLEISVSSAGVHSGSASGAIPETFRILRSLLDRVENSDDANIVIPEFNSDIPLQRQQQAAQAATMLADEKIASYPFLNGVQALTDDVAQLILNTTWRPTLCITGIDGLPNTSSAGNVLRPTTKVKLSLRVPPTVNPETAANALKETLEAEPPYQAHVTCHIDESGSGWNAPELAPWLEQATAQASQQFYGKPAAYLGEGGSIPFMGMLGEMYPQAQFLITGVLGPHSNAHGPNEFLHIPMAKKLTACVADIIAKHYQHFSSSD